MNKMNKPQLSKEESALYIKIVQQGNMDDMFEFGYVIGRERLAKESMERALEKIKEAI